MKRLFIQHRVLKHNQICSNDDSGFYDMVKYVSWCFYMDESLNSI